MNKQLEGIRERYQSSIDYGMFFDFTWNQMGTMLGIVDKQEEEITELKNGFEIMRIALIEMQDRDNAIIDKLQKQIAAGAKIVEELVWNEFDGDCPMCGYRFRPRSKKHNDYNCKLGKWLKEVGN